MSDEDDVDVPRLIGAITERTKLIFVCTPNNPTGTRMDDEQLRRILRLGLPTVIDEAYYEFAQEPRSMQFLMAEFPNALIMRTFSKAHGLAGLRVGYALGHPAQIRLLNRVKLPWNVSTVAIAAACAALEDAEEHERRLAELRLGRAYLARELSALPGIQVHVGDGNFVVIDAAGTGLLADEIVHQMLARGVLIRSLRSHRVSRSLVRVSVGEPEQNRRCVRAFGEVVRGVVASSERARAATVEL
jgi:histidinol-phosphate aminotransferase